MCTTDRLVRKRHEFLNQSLLNPRLTLCTNHIATGFVERMNLLRGQVTGDTLHATDDLIDERFGLSRLKRYEMSFTLLGNLDERVTCHVLHTCCGSVFGTNITMRTGN